MDDAGFCDGMARIRNEEKLGLWPSPMQFPGGLGGTDYVVSALNNHSWNLAERLGVVKQVAIALKKAPIHKIMTLNSGKGCRKGILPEFIH